MTDINDIAVNQVIPRIEEANPPVFWNLQGELYQFIVEAMNEAALITGEPQIRQLVPFTLAANTTLFTLPTSMLALLRLQAPAWIPKTSLWDLDRMLPGWESDVGTAPDYWFPYGLNQFGIHPMLNASITCFLTSIAVPVPTSAPYTGTEPVDFQNEYIDGFADYAGHACTLKEGGQEFIQSSKLYDRFLAKMTDLSSFAYRKGSLRFTRTVGAPAAVNRVEKK